MKIIIYLILGIVELVVGIFNILLSNSLNLVVGVILVSLAMVNFNNYFLDIGGSKK